MSHLEDWTTEDFDDHYGNTMKDEPWRGNDAMRCRHLEKKVGEQKKHLATLERKYLEARLSPDDRKVIQFAADRLVQVYGESPNVDFVLALRRIAGAGEDS